MASTNLDTEKDQIEAIFTSVSDALENILSKYRLILIKDSDDPVQESLFALIDELGVLKKKIIDRNEKISNRIESVGNVATYIEDLIADVEDYKQSAASIDANPIIHTIDAVEAFLGMGEGPEKSLIEDTFLNQSQTPVEDYFKAKKAELESLVAKYPALNS